jgi:alcohol dehydrogenase
MEEIGRTFSIRIPNTIVGVGGTGGLASLVRELGGTKALLVTDADLVRAGLMEPLKKSLDDSKVPFVLFDKCLPDAPLSVVAECARTAKDNGCDIVIGVGGGSVMDTAKVASVMARSDMGYREVFDALGPPGSRLPRLPKILIPTTAGTGSEWSYAAAVTDDLKGAKKIIMDSWADAVIIDPQMTLNLPSRVTADTGMDALIHAIEAFTSWKANLVSDMFAEKTIQLVSENLRPAVAKGAKHLEARYNMALAAAFGMAAGSASGLGAAHVLSYALAKKVHLTHGTGVCLMLPAVMEYNLPANPSKFARIALLMGESVEGLSQMEAARKSVNAVRELIRDAKMPQRLREVGIEKEDIPIFVEFVFQAFPIVKELNPRNITPEDTRLIYEAAW